MSGDISYCRECGLVYRTIAGHWCQSDLRGRVEKLERDVIQLKVCLENERETNKWLKETNKKLLDKIGE